MLSTGKIFGGKEKSVAGSDVDGDGDDDDNDDGDDNDMDNDVDENLFDHNPSSSSDHSRQISMEKTTGERVRGRKERARGRKESVRECVL